MTLGDFTVRADPCLRLIAELRWNYNKYLVETRHERNCKQPADS